MPTGSSIFPPVALGSPGVGPLCDVTHCPGHSTVTSSGLYKPGQPPQPPVQSRWDVPEPWVTVTLL